MLGNQDMQSPGDSEEWDASCQGKSARPREGKHPGAKREGWAGVYKMEEKDSGTLSGERSTCKIRGIQVLVLFGQWQVALCGQRIAYKSQRQKIRLLRRPWVLLWRSLCDVWWDWKFIENGGWNEHCQPSISHGFRVCKFSQTQGANLIYRPKVVEPVDAELWIWRTDSGT